MAVKRLATALLGLALLLPTSALAADCEADAQALLRKAESASMARRAPLILEAVARRDALGCGVVPASHWTSPAPVPEGCAADALETCPALEGGLPVAAQVSRDVDPALFVRVQTAAARLSAAGHLGRAHKRLLQLLLLSDAIRRGG